MNKLKGDLNLQQRIHKVMVDIKTIQKNGRNDFHKYDYATENDYVEALRPLLEKHGLSVTPKLLGKPQVDGPDGKGNYLTTISMAFNLHNIDDPEESVECVIPGQGMDKGDKGVYKALTGAKKYWAALTFLVATGDDPERDNPGSDGGRRRKKKTSRKKTYDELEDL